LIKDRVSDPPMKTNTVPRATVNMSAYSHTYVARKDELRT